MLLVRLPVNSRLLVVNLEGSRKLNSISDCVAAAAGGGGVEPVLLTPQCSRVRCALPFIEGT